MSEAFNNIRILIIDPTGNKDYKNSLLYPMKKQLEDLGTVVRVLKINQPPAFRNNYLPDKIKNIYRRVFFNDKHYYHFIEIKHYSRYYLNEFQKQTKGESYDYTFLLRPDRFSLPFIKQVRKKTDFLATYMWTAVKKGTEQNILKTRKYFDNAYGFDPYENQEYKNFNWKFSTNFIYNYPKVAQTKDIECLYFGSIYTNRRDLIAYNLFKEITNSFKVKIFIENEYLSKEKYIDDESVEYIDYQIPYFEYLYESSKAKVLLDIAKPEHKGLSFRFFECLKLETKLITNNTDVVNYDFYCPENIFIIDFNHPNLEKLNEFIHTPYKRISPEIIEKYSFENWMKYIFQMPGHEPIKYIY